MKTKKILAVIISIMMLFSCLVASAAVFVPQDSDVWTNLTDRQASDLLRSKSESFLFFFYRDACYNSQQSLPQFLNYATEHNMSLCGLNANEYPAWMDWANFLKPNQVSIGFPFLIAHNAETNETVAQDNVFTVKQFEDILKKVNLLPGENAVPSKPTTIPDKKDARFTDVAPESSYFDAVNQLASDGILTGYEDGTFKPDNSISRTEAAVVIVRAGKLETKSTKNSTYSDVSNSFWGKDYIMAASAAGIINGMGDGTFAPQNKVTRSQMIKMIVCLEGLEEEALEEGGWPKGYAKVARLHEIIDVNTYRKLNNSTYGNEPATRGEVSQWIYNVGDVNEADNVNNNANTNVNNNANTNVNNNANTNVNNNVSKNESEGFEVAGKVYSLGMPASELGVPDEMMVSINNFDWYVFGTETYEDFFAAGVHSGKVIALASSGVGFTYKGYKAGDTLKHAADNTGEFLLDKNDNNIIHGVFLIDNNYKNVRPYNLAGLESESKMNFHFTNGFRAYHKMPVYKWDSVAAEAARLHSEDMATNNYFNHTGLDGRNMGDRLRAQGVNWTTCAENIQAGRFFGIDAYDGWVNSSGHRKNILGNCTYLGVGFAYNENATYRFYGTQNFYSQESAFDSFFN